MTEDNQDGPDRRTLLLGAAIAAGTAASWQPRREGACMSGTAAPAA